MQSVPLEAPRDVLGCLADVLIKEAYANSVMGVLVDSLEPITAAA